MSNTLPASPNLSFYKKAAKELLAQVRAHDPDALHRFQTHHPDWRSRPLTEVAKATHALHDAQWVVAREHDFPSWPAFKRHIELGPVKARLLRALESDDRSEIARLLAAHPNLLHDRVHSVNWGPPLSIAALCGHLETVHWLIDRGARDLQHALGRALLRPNRDAAAIARTLISRGAKLDPTEFHGPCETFNAEGLRQLIELGLNPREPIVSPTGAVSTVAGSLFSGYVRNPKAKRACFEVLMDAGVSWPVTPVTAVHLGRLDQLEHFRTQDPNLLKRRGSASDIYPRDLAFHQGGEWAPVVGGTLLHLAIDLHDLAVAQWLLDRGADINAVAERDPDGIGGHTPLFHAVVCNRTADTAATTQWLIERGAQVNRRATLRQIIEWTDHPPSGTVFVDVSPLGFLRKFRACDFANLAAEPVLLQHGAEE